MAKFASFVCCMSFLAACTTPPAGYTPVSTVASVSSATILRPTERPKTAVVREAVVYAGPGNADFDPLATLPAGNSVLVLGSYGDFYLVETPGSDPARGFIRKKLIGPFDFEIPELAPDAVPLTPFFLPECSGGNYDAVSGSVIFSNPGDGYSDTESKAFSLIRPLRVRIGSLAVRGAMYGSVKILGVPEAKSAQYWKGMTRLDISGWNGNYRISVYDGSAPSASHSWDLPIRTDEPIGLDFDQVEGRSVRVLDKSGDPIEQIDLAQHPEVRLPSGLFPQGKVYFGTSTAPRSDLILTAFRLGTIPDGRWADLPEAGRGLAELAETKRISFGTEFSVFSAVDARYCRIMKRDFNLAALSEFSWKNLWLGPGQYDFHPMDRAVEYAERHGWRIRASHLVWGAVESGAIPDWLVNGRFTRDEYMQILKQHIQTVAGRYKGRVGEWSVANEATSRSFAGADFWNEKIGPDYVEMAFRWAREADPDGILIFNDFNNESPRDPDTRRVIDAMVERVREMKAGGVPIDAVGMQMHIFFQWSSPIPPVKSEVIATMRRFASLGVRVYITEFDVQLIRQTGTRAARWEYEAQLYRDMVRACWESGVCDSFTTWGISDSTSWLAVVEADGSMREPNADPLMFDEAFAPKPAYYAVRDALSY